MSKAFDTIIQGIDESRAYAEGKADLKKYQVHVPDEIDIRALRKRLKLTQVEFAHRFGFKLANLRNWEQGHRRPLGSARILLAVIAHEPKAVERALAKYRRSHP